MITIRKAVLDDKEDFAKLVLISAPYFQFLFGSNVKSILQDLFCHSSNLFSYEHVLFAEIEGTKAGMILGYDWKTKRQENLNTGFLLFKAMGVNMLSKFELFLKFNTTVGKLYNGEYYISNIAVYPEYRGQGVGKSLIVKVEDDAKKVGAKRMVLDVERDNIVAISFYRNLGYSTVEEFSIPFKKGTIFQFYRMGKEIK